MLNQLEIYIKISKQPKEKKRKEEKSKSETIKGLGYPYFLLLLLLLLLSWKRSTLTKVYPSFTQKKEYENGGGNELGYIYICDDLRPSPSHTSSSQCSGLEGDRVHEVTNMKFVSSHWNSSNSRPVHNAKVLAHMNVDSDSALSVGGDIHFLKRNQLLVRWSPAALSWWARQH